MAIEVKVPDPGAESITEGVILTWFKKNGEQVNVDDPLFELETDKVTLTVNAEDAGVLSIKEEEGAEVEIGQVVATLDPEASAGSPQKASPSKQVDSSSGSAPSQSSSGDALGGDSPLLSPAARHLLQEHGLAMNAVAGSGKDGRVLKEDVLRHVEAAKSAPKQKTLPSTPKPASKPASPKPKVSREPGERQTRTPMTSIRKRIAQRLVEAQQTAAILTTFNEVDMSAVMATRKRYQDSFVKKYGMKLGFMSFFVKAVVDALKMCPDINAQIDGTDIVHNNFYDIGIAVGTERGLVVPVVRDADKLGFAEIEMAIADLGKRARERKLGLDELQGGCFTISNGGVYGSLLSTPILNPPQSGILGMHGIKKRPVVVNDQIEIRPMMYLALSYDHRIVDGKEAVTFLKRVVECIENPDRMMLEV